MIYKFGSTNKQTILIVSGCRDLKTPAGCRFFHQRRPNFSASSESAGFSASSESARSLSAEESARAAAAAEEHQFFLDHRQQQPPNFSAADHHHHQQQHQHHQHQHQQFSLEGRQQPTRAAKGRREEPKIDHFDPGMVDMDNLQVIRQHFEKAAIKWKTFEQRGIK